MLDAVGRVRRHLAAPPGAWVIQRARYAARGAAAALTAFVLGLPLLVLSLLAVAFIPLGVGMFLLPPVTAAVRWVADGQRRVAGAWFGVPVPSPYRARPDPAPSGAVRAWRRCRWMVGDPATWRDLSWLFTAPVGLVLGLLPAGLVANGVEGIVVAPFLIPFVDAYRFGIGWALSGPAWLMAPLAVVQGALLLPAGLAAAPWLLGLRARFLHLLLAPTRTAALALRVDQLSRTRAEATDSQAAELRRIERDLHDGAQARIVALGMSLGMAEDLVLRDPASARALLGEARRASDTALSDLRELVRGIHPPVLAERGLDGAVRALALDLPVPVEVDVDLPGRPPAPIETAAYFAVAEALANVAKHSRAGSASVRLHGAGRLLRITVTDDGVGGADPRRGSGLRGIERRLAAHDGTLVVASPSGGATVLSMEVPCEWSSRRISRSSGTG